MILQIDEVVGVTNKWSGKTGRDEQVIAYHKSCVDYKLQASSLLLQANNLQKVCLLEYLVLHYVALLTTQHNIYQYLIIWGLKT